MFLMWVLTILVLGLKTTKAAVAVDYQKEDSEHPGMCHDKTSDSWKPVGTQWDHKCKKYICSKIEGDNGDYELQMQTCSPALMSIANCTDIPYNYSLPYPDCCPKKCIEQGSEN